MIPDTNIVYRIFNRENGNMQSAYSRAYHEEWAWDSAENARNSHCSSCFENKKKYRIAKYKVTFELIEEDCE